MEDIIIDEHITLDYDIDRKDKGLDEYRLTVFDKNLHYNDEIFLNEIQLYELFNGLKNIEFKINENL